MGRTKRRHEKTDQEDEIKRKIVKLQEKLGKKSRRRRIIESSSSSSESENESLDTRTENVRVVLSPLPPVSPQRDSEPTAGSSGTAAGATPANEPAIDAPDTDKELESDILELLGDAPKTDIVFGPAVHKDIANRWQDILSKGLQKETKEKLLKEYSTPSNCDLLAAPELNPEAKAALPEALIKRDSSILAKQKQIGIALSALAITINGVLQEDSKHAILKPLSDACRILCDSHFCETRTRRNFVLGAVNSTMKDTLLNAHRDKYLFGENVTEKLKMAKTIQKSGDDLKVSAPQKTQFNKNNFIKRNNNNNLNSQHRKNHPRGEARTTRGGFTQQRPATRYSVRLQRNLVPPPPTRLERSPPPPRRTARK